MDRRFYFDPTPISLQCPSSAGRALSADVGSNGNRRLIESDSALWCGPTRRMSSWVFQTF